MSDAPLDHWVGVTTNADGRVTGLDLDDDGGSSRRSGGGNNLAGQIPPELGGLSELELLTLGHNALRGPIPAELGRLVNLETLELYDNRLSGSIPSALGRLANLGSLVLFDNQLSGPIPAELAGLESLERLGLSYNADLGGPLPRTLMELPVLTELSIRGTGLCVPPDAAYQAWVDALSRFSSSGLTCDGLLISFTRASHTVAEGAQVPVTLHLSAAEAPDRAVTVPLTAAPGGGATAADFSGVPASVTFGPGDTEQSFDFEARTDAVADDGETVALGLGSPLPPGVAAGNPATATVTLVDVTTVTAAFGSTSYTAVEGGSVSVTVRLSRAPGRTVAIPLTAAPGSGATAADFSGVPASVTFGPTDTEQSFDLEARTDAVADDGETVALGLGSPLPPGVAAGNPAAATVTLVDATVKAAFGNAFYTAVEGGSVPVTVRLSQALGRAVTIPLTAAPGAGATAADFSGVPASVTFGPTDTEQSFDFEARTDAVADDGETVTLGLGSPLPPGVGRAEPSTATVTLFDHDYAARDREALVALYHATGGRRWTSRANWLSDEPLSTWAGVRTNGDGRVSRLLLDRNGLRGVLPATLGGLDALEWLALDRNELRGPIPPELGRLANLKWLYLFDNRLTGPIPPELGNLASLERLYLFDNQLTAQIPPDLGNLAGLERLYLNHNQLTGPIPPELGGLASLETLSLWVNQLTGPIPPELGELANLVRLYLDDNQLSGSVPDTLGNLTNLEHLHVPGNPLTGPLPQSLTQLSALDWFLIDRTGVCVPDDAAFQAWLAAIPAFTSSGLTCGASVAATFGRARYTVAEGESVRVAVRLSRPAGRALTIALTAEPGGGATASDYAGAPADLAFGPVDAVRTFRVRALADGDPDAGETVTLGFATPLPDGVSAGTPATATVTLVDDAGGGAEDRAILEALYHAAGGTSWTDNANWLSHAPLDQWFGVTTGADGRVTMLSLRENELAGAISAELGGLAYLERLDLGRNALTGSIPAELGDLSNLEELDLGWNALTGSIPAELGRLTNLERLALGGDWYRRNELNGVIPPELGGLSNLRYLDLGWNELAGAIPADLGRLSNLEVLDLAGNWLTGGIPSELARLSNLEALDLEDNTLTGSIPADLGRLSSLERLSLGGNPLTGPIPAALGRLSNLEVLHLRWNQLTGSIPAALGRLSNLELLSLPGNRLTGAVPSELGRLSNLERLFLQSNSLSGALPPELGDLTKLETLRLEFNADLSGPLPVALSPPLRQLDLHTTRVCAPPPDAAFEAWAATATFHPSGLICGAPPPAVSTIDVAVFYTPAAREAAGGTAAIEAGIDLMVAETNQAYRDSGVQQRVALAAREEVQYTEADWAGVDLDRLTDPEDGHMDGVHAIRDRVGADLVHLIAVSDDVCGIARLASRADSAFGLTGHECGGRSFAHELGHNMGLQHDRYEACWYPCSNWPTPYSYGYVNQRAFSAGEPRSRRWRTIMAYPTQCSDEDIYCSGLLRFSNPAQSWNGDPLGVPGDLPSDRADGPADAVRLLNVSRHAVAAFRDPPAGTNRPPEPVGTLPDRTLALGGTLVVDVSTAFNDPDGDVLSHAVSSSAPRVVTVLASGARVRLTAAGTGRATITVTATDRGGLSATQSFTVVVTAARFTDDPIRPGVTPIKAVHFTELRTRIDALRAVAGLAPFGWTDPALRPGVTSVRLAHLTDLRAALAQAYAAAGRPAPRWTDAAPAGGATAIKAAHLTELRAAVVALE